MELEGYQRTTNRLSDSLRILIGLRSALRHGLIIYGRNIPDLPGNWENNNTFIANVP